MNLHLLGDAELFQSSKRVFDGRSYELLYSAKSGIVYLIRFDVGG
jgi:hypothetical protein